ncbi:MAG: DEAD/DEAH box helicase family protein, partial [Thermomicrobium sp.]
MNKLKLHFDPNQPHQLQAVRSVVDLFDGLAKQDTTYGMWSDIIGNITDGDELDEEWLVENVRAVQRQNNAESAGSQLDITGRLVVDDGDVLDGLDSEAVRAPHFTLEMETGTGKTYVYLRTIRELFQKYGLRKFVIVVPSVAIFEGVRKAIEMTRDHLATL